MGECGYSNVEIEMNGYKTFAKEKVILVLIFYVLPQAKDATRVTVGVNVHLLVCNRTTSCYLTGEDFTCISLQLLLILPSLLKSTSFIIVPL